MTSTNAISSSCHHCWHLYHRSGSRTASIISTRVSSTTHLCKQRMRHKPKACVGLLNNHCCACHELDVMDVPRRVNLKERLPQRVLGGAGRIPSLDMDIQHCCAHVSKPDLLPSFYSDHSNGLTLVIQGLLGSWLSRQHGQSLWAHKQNRNSMFDWHMCVSQNKLRQHRHQIAQNNFSTASWQRHTCAGSKAAMRSASAPAPALSKACKAMGISQQHPGRPHIWQRHPAAAPAPKTLKRTHAPVPILVVWAPSRHCLAHQNPCVDSAKVGGSSEGQYRVRRRNSKEG